MNQIVLDKDVFHALGLVCEMAGGITSGPGNPWKQKCGCLLSFAAFLDGRPEYDPNRDSIQVPHSIYQKPTEDEPVLRALWEAYGARTSLDVWGKSDDACGYTRSTPLTWEEFCAKANIVPSL